ncbi:hypothetical protein [Chryseobacterium sp.]|uniref:hypothetical protein n=1 Tax=Chryseobacterium sp. TaxID=1871047 RepID=UPI00289D145B|nr:hypothetical protein [Chryseobacterium sp.]
MKKVYLLTILMTALFSCQKTEKMKEKLFPEKPYQDAKIDKFYWAINHSDIDQIPLIKPVFLSQYKGKDEWSIKVSDFNKSEIISNLLNPVLSFNVNNIYIYGFQDDDYFGETNEILFSKKWFIINTQEKQLVYFDKESDFREELKKLNLAEEFLNPNEVYEQYKQNPILPWFPENIKKQLEEVKAKKKNK